MGELINSAEGERGVCSRWRPFTTVFRQERVTPKRGGKREKESVAETQLSG